MRYLLPVAAAAVLALAPAQATCTDLDGDGYYQEEGCGGVLDCNDAAPQIYPGRLEICNGVDDDCDRSLDESASCDGTIEDPTLSVPARVSSQTGKTGEAAVAWLGSGFAVVYRVLLPGTWQIRLRLYSPDLVPLSEELTIASSINIYNIAISWNGNRLGIAYPSNGAMQFISVSPSGAVLSGPVTVSEAGTGSNQAASITWSGTDFGIAWLRTVDDIAREIHFARVGQDGSLHTPPVRLNGPTPSHVRAPSIAWSGARYVVVWTEMLGDSNLAEIYARFLDRSGALVSATVQLTSNSRESTNPVVTWASDRFGLAWTDASSGTYSPYLMTFAENGAKLMEARVADTPGTSYATTLVWTGDEFIVVSWTPWEYTLSLQRVNKFGVLRGPAVQLVPPPSYVNAGPDAAAWSGSVIGFTWEAGSPTDAYFASISAPCTTDADGDGFLSCNDCDDARPDVYRHASQLCDGVNNDCEDPSWPSLPQQEQDEDGDEWSVCEGDCNDSTAEVYPGAPELCDRVANDCLAPSWPDLPPDERDLDQDWYAICDGDCDDTRPDVYPEADDYCNDIDENCDGYTGESCPFATWIDCDDGDDANDGSSSAQPKRTFAGALLGHASNAPAELHVLPGVCPDEGVVELPNVTTIEGLDRESTVVLSDLFPGGWVCSYDEEADCRVSFKNLTLASVWPYCGVEVTFDGIRGEYISASCHDEWPPLNMSIVGSEVQSVGVWYGADATIDDSRVSFIGVFGDGLHGGHVVVVNSLVSALNLYYGGAWITRSTITGTVGTRPADDNSWASLQITDSLFEGGKVTLPDDDDQDGSPGVTLLRNTFSSVDGDAVSIEGRTGQVAITGNAFAAVTGAAIRARNVVLSSSAVTRNNFDSVNNPLCVEECGASGCEEDCSLPPDNTAFPSGFVSGHYWLTGSSPLIDIGDSSIAPTLDRDGLPRPMDGNGDGLGIHDIGAFEFNDPDQDGTDTRLDNCPVVANPAQADGDSDGVGNACDDCPTVSNSDQADSDQDGVGDLCDNCPASPNSGQADVDTDGWGDACDNCPSVTNPGQADFDVDGWGDLCDNCQNVPNTSQADQDSDGPGNACDNCPEAYNPDQLDSDSDGSGNSCDNCIIVPNASQLDTDSDERGDACDNCPQSSNPFQDDLDADRRGDVCDNCLFDYNSSQSDFNTDQEGDRCDLNDGLIYLFNSGDRNYVEWQDERGFTSWNVYRGDVAVLRSTGVYTQAPGSNALAARTTGLTEPWLQDVDPVAAGKVAFYLVTGMSNGIESSLGTDSHGNERPFGEGIVFGNATASSDLFPTSGNPTVSYSHTVGAELGEAFLLVFINGKQGPGAAMANCRAITVTYGGTALMPAGMASAVDGSDFKTVVEAWYLVSPPPGSGVLQMTFPGECSVVQSDAVSLGNVDQSAPIRGTASSTITASQVCTVATPIIAGVGGWAIDAFAYNRSLDASPQFPEQTERADYHSSVGSLESSTGPGGDSPSTLGWNVGSALCGRAVHLVVAVGPS